MFGAGAAFEMRQIGFQLSSMRRVPGVRFRVSAASMTQRRRPAGGQLRSGAAGGGYHAPHGCFSVFVSAMLGWGLFLRRR